MQNIEIKRFVKYSTVGHCTKICLLVFNTLVHCSETRLQYDETTTPTILSGHDRKNSIENSSAALV